MKTRSILFLAALASAVFTGCTNDDEAGQAQLPDLSGTPIRIQAGINEGALTRTEGDGSEGAEDGTQAATQLLTSGEFGLFLTTPGTEGNERYNATNMKFSRAEGAAAWTSDPEQTQLLWKNSTTQVEYYAYMPYVEDAAITDGVYSFTLPTAQDTEFEKADLLCAPRATASATDDAGNIGVLGITFQHALTRLTVVLERGNADDYKGLVFSSVKLMGCATGAEVNLKEGEVSNPTGSGDITLREAAKDSYECILIPQTGTTLAVTIEAEGQRFFQYTSGEVELKPGTHYTLKLTVGHNALTAGSVSLADWQEGSWGSEQNPETGTAEEIIPGADPETHTIVTLKPGQIAANKDWIAEAMGEEGILEVSGPMNQADMNAISNKYKIIKELDLSEATGEIVITNFSVYPQLTLLTKLTLGSNVTSIGDNAFAECASLREVDLSACSNLTSIGTFAFQYCGITDLKLPENGILATIEASAFRDNKLQSITFPETLTKIGTLPFGTPTAIETVVFLSQKPPLVEILNGSDIKQGDFTNLFIETDRSNITIYLPNVQREDAEAWEKFFGGETNYKEVKYGESPATANP